MIRNQCKSVDIIWRIESFNSTKSSWHDQSNEMNEAICEIPDSNMQYTQFDKLS